MSQRLHICRICGKKFATPKGVCGHQRIHSGFKRIWGFKESRVCSASASFMTEIEKHEVIEAAMNLVMLSRGVYDFAAVRNLLRGGDDFMDLEVSHSCFEKLSTCSDVVAQELASYLRSKLKKKTQIRNSRYKCKICGKSFVCSKVLGGHQTLHRSNKGLLARKMEYTEVGNSLSDSLEAKKIVSQSASFEISQKDKILHSVEPKLDFSKRLSHWGFNKSSSFGKTRFSSPPEAEKIVPQPPSFEISEEEKMLHSVEPNLDFSKLLSHSGFEKSSSCSKTRFDAFPSPAKKNLSQEEKILHSVEPKLSTKLVSDSGFNKSSSCSKTRFDALPSPLRSKSHSTYRFKICGKSFKCSQARSDHKTLHRSIKGQLPHTEDGNSLSES